MQLPAEADSDIHTYARQCLKGFLDGHLGMVSFGSLCCVLLQPGRKTLAEQCLLSGKPDIPGVLGHVVFVLFPDLPVIGSPPTQSRAVVARCQHLRFLIS